jgi:DNA-binding transcriptional MerR regulator
MFIANRSIAEDHGLLTVKQVAEMAGISPQVLHYARRMGRVPQPMERAGDGLARYYSPEAAAQVLEYFRQQHQLITNH